MNNFVFEGAENIVEKRSKCWLPDFLLFPQYFQKPSFLTGTLEEGDCLMTDCTSNEVMHLVCRCRN